MLLMARLLCACQLSRYRHICANACRRGHDDYWDCSIKAWKAQKTARLDLSLIGAPPADLPGEVTADSKELSFWYDCRDCSNLATLVSFLAAPGHANGMDNRQTRMLAGALAEPLQAEPRPAAELFPLALEHLATRVDLALTVEHFDLGVALLSRLAGKPPPRSYLLIKEDGEQATLPCEARDRGSWVVRWAKKTNRFDEALHAHATRQLLAWGAEAGLIQANAEASSEVSSEVGSEASRASHEQKKPTRDSFRTLTPNGLYLCEKLRQPRPINRSGIYFATAECTLVTGKPK